MVELKQWTVCASVAGLAIILFLLPLVSSESPRRLTQGRGHLKKVVAKAELGLDFAGQDLEDKSFVDQDLTGAAFDERNLAGVQFQGCNLRNASFRNASLSGTSMNDCIIAGADFTDAVVYGLQPDSGIKESTIPVFLSEQQLKSTRS